MNNDDPKLKFLSLELSPECDQNCKHCYANSLKSQVENILTFEQWLDVIKAAKKIGCEEIRLTGGEPTLSPYFFKIIKAAHQIGLKIGFNTHGVLSNAILAKIVSAAPERIFISFEGSPKTDAEIRGKKHFQRAFNSAKFLKQAGLEVLMNVHLRKSNYREIEKLSKIAVENNFILKLPFLRPIGRAAECLTEEILNPDQTLVVAKETERVKIKYPALKITSDYQLLGDVQQHMLNHCPAGIVSIHINPDGTAFPCGFMRADDFKLGNIKKISLKQIWFKSPLLIKMRKVTGAPKCQHCEYFKSKCSGPARCFSYYLNGKLFSDDPICFAKSKSEEIGLEFLKKKVGRLPKKERELFNKIFDLKIDKSEKGDNIISLRNKIEMTQGIYNVASRQGRPIDPVKLKKIRKLCDQVSDCKICKKGRGKQQFLDALPGAYTKHHKVLFFDKHNPTNITPSLVTACLKASVCWSQKEAFQKKKYYPYIFWNTLIGSEIHGHAHLILAEDLQFAEVEDLSIKAKSFGEIKGKNYWESLFKAHLLVGLAKQVGRFKYFMNLVPKSSREIFIFGKTGLDEMAITSLSLLVSKICQNWINRTPFRVPALSIFISYPLPQKVNKDKLTIVRIVDRRYPLLGKTDRGTVEEFAFKVVTHDPFEEWKQLEKTLK